MFVLVVVMVVICWVVFRLYVWNNQRREGFSFLTDDISRGNPVSMSGALNPRMDITEKGVRNPIIYQSHGVPLLHEDHSTIPTDTHMFYFDNYSCRPECCTYSSYSCNNGCVCWQPPITPVIERNYRISPRS